jgi:hypothetical protein
MLENALNDEQKIRLCRGRSLRWLSKRGGQRRIILGVMFDYDDHGTYSANVRGGRCEATDWTVNMSPVGVLEPPFSLS